MKWTCLLLQLRIHYTEFIMHNNASLDDFKCYLYDITIIDVSEISTFKNH